jgi:iron complex outermembrane receptor protein
MTALRTWVPFCLVWSTVAALARSAEPAATLTADVGPRPVAEALAAFGRQTELQLIYVATIADAQQSRGARAGLTVSEALTQLLDGTGLRFEFLNPRTVRIYAPPLRQTASQKGVASAPHSFRQRAAPAVALEEVIVTATRREERADKVPISMVVWTQEAMEASGIRGMDEIGALTPGVDFGFDEVVGAAGYTSLVIRGVQALHGITTGVFIDDARVPAARGDTFLRSFPWAFDLDRVEVLRGPQGTLLGQGTLGGGVRFIMNQPSLTTFSGLARGEFSTTARGAASYETGAAAGGPLVTDALGYRVSGWYRTDGGYVDRIDPLTGATVEANSNKQWGKSGRAALTWAPTGGVDITPSFDYESFSIRDTPVFYWALSDPKGGILRNGSLVQQPYQGSFYLASVKLHAALRVADLSAVTSYFHRTDAVTVDWSDAAFLRGDLRQRTFSQELRLSSADPSAALTWIVGSFYSAARNHEASSVVTAFGDVENPNATRIDESQLEGFGHIGFRMTQRLTASAGVRIGRDRYDALTETPQVLRDQATETWVTPRYGLSYQHDEHNLFYLAIAKGYRGGGVYPAIACGGPDVFPSDSVWSYELGAKNDLGGGRVHIEPSMFQIRWNNREPGPFAASCRYIGQPGDVVSNGFELLAHVVVSERIKTTLALAYIDAHHTRTIKAGSEVIVLEGDALEASAPWNATAVIDYRFGLMRGITANLRAEDIFRSSSARPSWTVNPASPLYVPGRLDPSTNVLNLRGIVHWPDFDLALFVNNALDLRPTLGEIGNPPSGVARTLRPRTIGLSGTRRF